MIFNVCYTVNLQEEIDKIFKIFLMLFIFHLYSLNTLFLVNVQPLFYYYNLIKQTQKTNNYLDLFFFISITIGIYISIIYCVKFIKDDK